MADESDVELALRRLLDKKLTYIGDELQRVADNIDVLDPKAERRKDAALVALESIAQSLAVLCELAHRTLKPKDGGSYGKELADIIIRTVDLAHALGIDLDEAVDIKMAYNATRPYKHGRKRL